MTRVRSKQDIKKYLEIVNENKSSIRGRGKCEESKKSRKEIKWRMKNKKKKEL